MHNVAGTHTATEGFLSEMRAAIWKIKGHITKALAAENENGIANWENLCPYLPRNKM